MSNEIATIPDDKLNEVLRNSFYPGASDMSLELVKNYCKAAELDIMLRPVHIVPLWSSQQGRMVDQVMPGIGLYRTIASRTNEYAGIEEPIFGPIQTQVLSGVEVSFPEWCKVTVKRKINGHIAEFTAKEYWLENYAVKGGKERSIAPNSMWARRVYGQIAKVAEAQALRKAFPEVGSQPTAEEMEGKPIQEIEINPMQQSKKVSLEDTLKSIETMEIEDFKSIDRNAFTSDELAILKAACVERRKAIKNRDVIDVKPEKSEDIDWSDKIQKCTSVKRLNELLKDIPEIVQIELHKVIDDKFDDLEIKAG